VAKPTPVNPNLDATAHAYDAAGLSTSATRFPVMRGPGRPLLPPDDAVLSRGLGL